MSIFQSRLNDALGCQQKNKKSLQELEIKLRVFNNDRSLDFLTQSLKSKLSEEKCNKENHLEDKQQTGKNYLCHKNYNKKLRHFHCFFHEIRFR